MEARQAITAILLNCAVQSATVHTDDSRHRISIGPKDLLHEEQELEMGLETGSGMHPDRHCGGLLHLLRPEQRGGAVLTKPQPSQTAHDLGGFAASALRPRSLEKRIGIETDRRAPWFSVL